jgi:hypothetical protein
MSWQFYSMNRQIDSASRQPGQIFQQIGKLNRQLLCGKRIPAGNAMDLLQKSC